MIDFFAGLALAGERPAVIEAIVLAPAVADATVAALAALRRLARGGPDRRERAARAAAPEIIAAMSMNRRARMSTIDRVVELAVRNDVRVPGLAAWDEVARALTGGASAGAQDDALIEGVLAAASDDSALTAGDAELPPPEAEAAPGAPGRDVREERDEKDWDRMSVPAKIRAATLGNASTRAKAIRSPNRLVAMAAIKAPGLKDMEAVHYAGNQNLPEDVIRFIASKREWTKLYGVKVALCRNPKTPLVEATRLIASLREKDIQVLAKSKGVPSALAARGAQAPHAAQGQGLSPSL